MTIESFTGVLRNNLSVLHWKTANEINIKEFSVERSLTGGQFQEIARVTANAAFNNNYTFIDSGANALASFKVYYRLKQTDRDGSFTYSPTVNVRFRN